MSLENMFHIKFFDPISTEVQTFGHNHRLAHLKEKATGKLQANALVSAHDGHYTLHHPRIHVDDMGLSEAIETLLYHLREKGLVIRYINDPVDATE